MAEDKALKTIDDRLPQQDRAAFDQKEKDAVLLALGNEGFGSSFSDFKPFQNEGIALEKCADTCDGDGSGMDSCIKNLEMAMNFVSDHPTMEGLDDGQQVEHTSKWRIPTSHIDLQCLPYARCQVLRLSQPTQHMSAERACIDEFSTERSRQFCRVYKVSKEARKVMIARNQKEPNDGSPSKPFFNDPSLGVGIVLGTVFRARGTLASGLGSNVFSCWVASPTEANNEAFAFTAGHCFAGTLSVPYTDNDAFDFKGQSFSQVVGCFGSDVRDTEFNVFGFSCSSKPIALAYDDEDFALFKIMGKSVDQFLLPCSPEIECGSNDRFIATFSYPCTTTFLADAYEELIEKKENHGIKELYDFLGMDDDDLYRLLSDTFKAFTDGELICSPGALKVVKGVHCYYKCSTVGGSSGGPVVPIHLPGYIIGIHEGAAPDDDDLNISTSTDSPNFVTCYSEHVLPRLPQPDSEFWAKWNLDPFLRWLERHNLKWKVSKKRKRYIDVGTP